METKLFEVLDRITAFGVVATKLKVDFSSADSSMSELFLLMDAGYKPADAVLGRFVTLYRIGGHHASYNFYAWDDRTYRVAHRYIAEHFDNMISGSVIDVEYILGEKDAPGESARYSEGHPLHSMWSALRPKEGL